MHLILKLSLKVHLLGTLGSERLLLVDNDTRRFLIRCLSKLTVSSLSPTTLIKQVGVFLARTFLLET